LYAPDATMHSPEIEAAVRIIAENVVLAVEREQENIALHPLIYDALMVELLREVLSVMPTESGTVLVNACSRCLDRIADFHLPTPRVTAVDPADGSVTMVAV
jgi:hypothetical protein